MSKTKIESKLSMASIIDNLNDIPITDQIELASALRANLSEYEVEMAIQEQKESFSSISINLENISDLADKGLLQDFRKFARRNLKDEELDELDNILDSFNQTLGKQAETNKSEKNMGILISAYSTLRFIYSNKHYNSLNTSEKIICLQTVLATNFSGNASVSQCDWIPKVNSTIVTRLEGIYNGMDSTEKENSLKAKVKAVAKLESIQELVSSVFNFKLETIRNTDK